MKCAFHVWMARSAAFRRWICGGTRWKETLYLVKACLISLEHSLSMMCRCGAYPRCCMLLVRSCKYRCEVLAVLGRVGSSSIPLRTWRKG